MKINLNKLGSNAAVVLEFFLKGFVIIVAYVLSVGQVKFNKDKADDMAGLSHNLFASVLSYAAIIASLIVTTYTRIPAILKTRKIPKLDPSLENLSGAGKVLHKGLFTLNIGSGIFASNSTSLFARTLLMNYAAPASIAFLRLFYPTSSGQGSSDEETLKMTSESMLFRSLALAFGVARFVQFLKFNLVLGNLNSKILAKKIEKRDFTFDKATVLSAAITTLSTIPVPLQAYQSTPNAIKAFPFTVPDWLATTLTASSMVTSATSHFTQSGPTMSRAFNSFVNFAKNIRNPYADQIMGPKCFNPHDTLFFTAATVSAAYDLYVNTIFTNLLAQSMFGLESSGLTYGVSSGFAVCFALAAFFMSREGYYNTMGYRILSNPSDYERPLAQDELDDVEIPQEHIPADDVELAELERFNRNRGNEDGTSIYGAGGTAELHSFFSRKNEPNDSDNEVILHTNPSETNLPEYAISMSDIGDNKPKSRCGSSCVIS